MDSNELLEYSVVYTERSLNHMSQTFQRIMNEISKNLKEVYNAQAVAIVPGSGTFAMESVARQFATGKKCLVIRNGWFSFRWTQILEMANIPSEAQVLKARMLGDERDSAFVPAPIEEVVALIKKEKPEVVFAPHVETSSGIILPEDYLRSIGDAVHSVGGLFVVDCIASGAIWLDMEDCAIDILISAPQKGWSSSPCCGLVMMSPLARERIENTTSTSFAVDLRKWLQIMETYEGSGHAYYATMPTDGLARFSSVVAEMKELGFAKCKTRQEELGKRVRELLEAYGYKSVSAAGFQAPGVIVSYTSDQDIQSGKKFLEAGVQIAAGVPLRCDEREDFQTFRIGLFGLDKLKNPDRCLVDLKRCLGLFAD